MIEPISLTTGIIIGLILGALLFFTAWNQRYKMYHNLHKKYETSHIQLYTFKEAEEDVKSGKLSGKAASILKWKRINHAIRLIYDTVSGPCGLCIEFGDPDCSICPLHETTGQDCNIEDSQYQATRKSMKTAWNNTHKMLHILKKV